MDHLLRMWKVTPCSPQPQETWTHTGLCLLGKCFNHNLGKCFNHKHSTKIIGATTCPHPGAAAGMACKKRTRWLALLEWVTQVPNFSKWLQSTVSSCTLAYYSGWATGEHLSPWEWQGFRWIPLFNLCLLAVLWALVLCVSSLSTSKLPVCGTGKISGSDKAVNSTLIAWNFKIRG